MAAQTQPLTTGRTGEAGDTLTCTQPTNGALVSECGTTVQAPASSVPGSVGCPVEGLSRVTINDKHGSDVDDSQMSNSHRHGEELVGDHYFSSEDVPPIRLSNGRTGYSQEEDSGSESGLITGGIPVAGENGTQTSLSLHAYSSASTGEGSSVWSEEDSKECNEQGSPHYDLLDSGGNSELSSPGETPPPFTTADTRRENPYSLSDDCTTDMSVQIPNGGPATAAQEECPVSGEREMPLAVSVPSVLVPDMPQSVHEHTYETPINDCTPDTGCEVGQMLTGGSASGVPGVVESLQEEEKLTHGGSERGEESDGEGVVDEPGACEGEDVRVSSSEGGDREGVSDVVCEGDGGEVEDEDGMHVGTTESICVVEGEGVMEGGGVVESEGIVEGECVVEGVMEGGGVVESEGIVEGECVVEGEEGDGVVEGESTDRIGGEIRGGEVECGSGELGDLQRLPCESEMEETADREGHKETTDSSSLDCGVSRPPLSQVGEGVESEGAMEGRRGVEEEDGHEVGEQEEGEEGSELRGEEYGTRSGQVQVSTPGGTTEQAFTDLDQDRATDTATDPAPRAPPIPLIHTPSPDESELVLTSESTDISESRQRSSTLMEDIDNPLLESNLDSSNLDSGVRRHPSSELPVLQPLSPDPDLNEQYEYLRRTLSHSRRRYSTRRRRPPRRDRSERVQRSGSDARGDHQAMRNMLQSREERVETHVDVHGRTYFMDHHTHTVTFEPGRGQPNDVNRGMEMLERRYLSLQRSFRGQRPSRFAAPNLAPISSSPSTPTDLSLSLTRAEAESLSQANIRAARSQSGASNTAQRSKRKSSRWRFWQRSYKTVSQSTSSAGDDDILPISPGWEGSPPPAVTASGEVVERGGVREVRSVSVEGSDERSSGSRSSDATLTGSVAGAGEEGVVVLEEMPAAGHQPAPATQDEVMMRGEGEGEGEGGGEGEGEGNREGGGEAGDEVFTEAATLQSRHHSIMRASDAEASVEQSAGRVVGHRVRATTVRSRRRGRHSRPDVTHRDTDDETNEAPSPARVPITSPTPEETEPPMEEKKEAEPVTPTTPTPLPEELLTSAALKFITRRDLYSFLSNAAEAGELFLANRGLMELVQRIRTNNNLFAKYQHSRQLVVALNRFADRRADLPQNWEKKLNREGKVFFIDHTHCLTSFIDPRLPLPDHEFTYTSSTPTTSHRTQELQFGEEAPLRSHHTTVVSSTTSPTPSDSPPPSVTVTSPQPPLQTEMTYERQVVSFFRHSEAYQKIAQRYHRGVRPQLREIIEDIRANGTPALERIQTSGSVAAYELALVLSLFEEDISAINTMIEAAAPQPAQDTVGTLTASTLQRKKEAFSTKLQTFKVMMARLGFAQSARLKFNIRRDHLLEDSYEHVMKSDVKHLQRKRLNICFRGEDGLDYGGPSREFFFLLSREIFNPYYGLFEYSANDTYTVQISPTSMFLQNNLDWFRFAGRVIGLVIVQGFLLDVFFTRTIYKALANRPPSLKDLESLEPAFYSSLVWILENDPEPLDLTFTVEEEAFGELSTHELKEGGMDIPVTDDNKEEYISLMLRWRLDRGITSQINMIKKGFSEVMPVSLLQVFDASELEFLTAGTLEIDVEDWKKHTEYRNGYHPTHPVILNFWQAVEMFDNEQRLRLLQFVTGTSSVPFEGFKALRGSNGPKRFTIDFFSDVNSLPRTHTCFNRIDLPPYPSYDILYHKLQIAIEEGNTFGIE